MAYGLGLDVGTTFTAAAVWEQGRASVMPLAQRSDAVPTLVYVPEEGQWVVGDAAERHAPDDPTRLARAFKRRLGDPVPLRLGSRDVPAMELTAHMIGWVLAIASDRQGEPPAHAVLTVPAQWGVFRLDLVREAASRAGLQAVELVPEPVAAAVYYSSQHRVAVGETVGVFDLGGGTFDATLVRRTGSGYEIRGEPTGDPSLGGIDLDDEILAHVRESVDLSGVDVDSPQARAGLVVLRSQVVLAKEALSEDVDTAIPVVLPGVARTVRLTRRELEERSQAYVDRAVASFSAMLDRANVRPDELSAVLLVGGGSRMPLVAERLTASLGLAIAVDTHPKYAVCLGAAVLAGAHLSGAPAPVEDAGSAVTATAAPLLEPTAPSAPSVPVAHAPEFDLPAVNLPRRQSRVWIAADLAETGVLPRSDASPERRDEPLVVRTGGSSRRKVLALVVAALAVLVVALLWNALDH
jgi:molecular chaperone DnaK (HSP70)